jgi:Ca2+-binding EF-hand superfamily protein
MSLRLPDDRVSTLECLAALAVTAGKATLGEKVEVLFSLFDFSETGKVTYDEMVILASSVLSGAVKISGQGNLPEDAAMEKLIDRAYLEVSRGNTHTHKHTTHVRMP